MFTWLHERYYSIFCRSTIQQFSTLKAQTQDILSHVLKCSPQALWVTLMSSRGLQHTRFFLLGLLRGSKQKGSEVIFPFLSFLWGGWSWKSKLGGWSLQSSSKARQLFPSDLPRPCRASRLSYQPCHHEALGHAGSGTALIGAPRRWVISTSPQVLGWSKTTADVFMRFCSWSTGKIR